MRFVVTLLLLLQYIYILHAKKFSKFSKHGKRKYVHSASKGDTKAAVSMPAILRYLQQNKPMLQSHRTTSKEIIKKVEKNIPENPFVTDVGTLKHKNITHHPTSKITDDPSSFITEETLHLGNTKANEDEDDTDLSMINLSNWASPPTTKNLLTLHQINFPKLLKYLKNNKKRRKTVSKTISHTFKKPKRNHKSHHSKILDYNAPKIYKGKKANASYDNNVLLLRHIILDNNPQTTSVKDIPIQIMAENLQELKKRRFLDKNSYINILRRRKQKYGKYNVRKDHIPFPTQTKRDDIFYNRRNDLPMYSSIPSNTMQQNQLLSYPAQYPELMNLQPMNRLYTSVQGLDGSEEDILDKFLKKERMEEERFKQSDVDKMIQSDEKGELFQGAMTGEANHAVPNSKILDQGNKILDQGALNDISNADQFTLSDVEKLNKNILKDTSGVGQGKLMGASLFDSSTLSNAHNFIHDQRKLSSDTINDSPSPLFKVAAVNKGDAVVTAAKDDESDGISKIKQLDTDSNKAASNEKSASADEKIDGISGFDSKISNGQTLKERKETDKEAIHLLRNKAIRRKLENIKLLQDKLQTLQLLEQSRRKHLMMSPAPATRVVSPPNYNKPHGITNQALPMLKTFFHHPEDQKVEELPAIHKNTQHNTSISGFQDALFDRGRILKWKYRDIAAAKKELAEHHLPIPPDGYFYKNHADGASLPKTPNFDTDRANLPRARNFHLMNFNNRSQDDETIDEIINQSEVVISNDSHSKSANINNELDSSDEAVNQLKSILDSAETKDLKNASIESDTESDVGAPLKDIISEFQKGDAIVGTEKDVGRSMNEFTFQGKVKLDPNYEGNVKIVHGTPPPELVEAFATQFPPTPFKPIFTLPPGHATQQAHLPTFKNDYPLVWYKNGKLRPTTSRYRDAHAHFTTRAPTVGDKQSAVKPTMKPTVKLPTNTQPPVVIQTKTTASPLSEDYVLHNNNTIQTSNTSKQSLNIPPEATDLVDGEVVLSNDQPETTLKPPVVMTTVKLDDNTTSDSISNVLDTSKTITKIYNTTIIGNETIDQETTPSPKTTQSPAAMSMNKTNKTKTVKETSVNTIEIDGNNDAMNKSSNKGSVKSIAAPLYITYNQNAHHHLQPDDIILNDAPDFETKQYIQPKIISHKNIASQTVLANFDTLRDAQIGYKKGRGGHLLDTHSLSNARLYDEITDKISNESEEKYYVKPKLDDTGDKRNFQQYSSYTLNEDMGDVPKSGDEIKNVSKEIDADNNKPVTNEEETNSDSVSTQTKSEHVPFHEVDALKTLLSPSESDGTTKKIGNDALKTLLSSGRQDGMTGKIGDGASKTLLSPSESDGVTEKIGNDASETYPSPSEPDGTRKKIEIDDSIPSPSEPDTKRKNGNDDSAVSPSEPDGTKSKIGIDNSVLSPIDPDSSKRKTGDGLKTLLSPTEPEDGRTKNMYKDLLKTMASPSEPTTKKMEDFENDDKIIDTKTMPTSSKFFATKSVNYKLQVEPDVAQDKLMREYSMLSQQSKKYTEDILRRGPYTEDGISSVHATDTPSHYPPTTKPIELPLHVTPPVANETAPVVAEQHPKNDVLTTPKTTTPETPPTTTSPQATISTTTTVTTTATPEAYKPQSSVTSAPSKTSQIVYPTVKLYTPIRSENVLPFITHSHKTSILPDNSNQINKISTADDSMDKSHTLTPLMYTPLAYQPQPALSSQEAVPSVTSPTLMKMESHAQPRLDYSVTQPIISSSLPLSPSYQSTKKVPKKETTKLSMDEELNMDDMYWTDSTDEIENACRQQKGTNLVVRILAFGDSLTRGYYNKGKNHHPYTMKLQYLLNKMDAKKCFIVENEGKDGDLAFGEMPKRVETVLNESKKQYDWVIILGGTNDIYNKFHAGKHTATELTQNILSVHEISHQHGARTVVVTIPDVECESSEMCQDMKQTREGVNANLRTYSLEHKSNVILCDLADSLARHNMNHKLIGQFFEGGLHLKPRGYEKMAKLMFDSLKQTLDK